MIYPKSLFKYRRFDKYTISMLKNGSIYFCPAYRLDDPFECSIYISEKIKEGDFSKYIKEMLPFILKQIISTSSNHNLNNIDVNSFYDENGFNSNKFRLIILSHDKTVKNSDINKVIELIKKFESVEDYPDDIKRAIKTILNVQHIFGVYSLSEINNNQPMWVLYSNNYEGYCIEYDIEKFLMYNCIDYEDLRPVNYSDKRDNDLIKIILEIFYNLINSALNINYKKMDTKELLIKIVTTKTRDWRYQKEWRFLGKAGQNDLCLPIKSVYIGKNIKPRNKKIILNIAKENNFTVYQQYLDYKTSQIKFRKIDK